MGMDEYLVAHPELAAQMEASRRRAEKEAAELAEIRKRLDEESRQEYIRRIGPLLRRLDYVDTLEYNSPSNK